MQYDDIALMQKIAGGDQNALLELYQKYGRAVFSLAYRVLNNSVLAEEVTQDTFLKVWHQSTRWDSERGKLKSWLMTIAQFTAIDRLRQERRQPAVLADALDDSDETVIFGEQGQWQEGTTLHLLITQLPPEQASLIELAFFYGMSHNDIAVTLHIPLGTVKTRLRSGLKRLREMWMESTIQ